MKQYGTQRSTVKPEDVEITESKVFTYESITEIKVKNHESDDEITMYEFTLTEYDKDEYIRIQAEKNASLEEQMTQAQEAMCEIYEMMVQKGSDYYGEDLRKSYHQGNQNHW